MRLAGYGFVLALGLLQPGCATIDPRGALASREWIEVNAPENRKIKAIIARPKGDGPFPIIIILHGTDGFRHRYVELAEAFAKQGFVAIAGCWFGGHYFFRGRFEPSGRAPHHDAITCSEGPVYKWATFAATRDVTAIIEAARKLPEVKPDRIGLFGHSRGGVVALLTASIGGNVQAVATSAAHYLKRQSPDTPVINMAEMLTTPVLLLNGTADELVHVQEATEYVRVLRRLGKPVEMHIYEGAPHDLPFDWDTSEDVFRRAVTFFRKYLE